MPGFCILALSLRVSGCNKVIKCPNRKTVDREPDLGSVVIRGVSPTRRLMQTNYFLLEET
jgi:hypothetical protein